MVRYWPWIVKFWPPEVKMALVLDTRPAHGPNSKHANFLIGILFVWPINMIMQAWSTMAISLESLIKFVCYEPFSYFRFEIFSNLNYDQKYKSTLGVDSK